jgi:integrase
MSLPSPKKQPDGRWMARYSAPPGPDGRRRQPRVYGATQKECKDNLIKALGHTGTGRATDERKTKFGPYLERRLAWWESEKELKPSTLSSYREAVTLYLRPAFGHLKNGDLTEGDFRDLAAAMRKINRPEADTDRTDLLKRLLAVRAGPKDGRRRSTRPLTEARIKRIIAVASSALSDLVPHVLTVNPAAATGKRLGKGRKVKPLLWTPPRIERWRATGLVPAPVMVWDQAECYAFLDAIRDDRLYALYHLTAHFGLRRSELCGLDWADVDLKARRIHVRQAQVDDELDSTKTEDSERIITIDQVTADVLAAWRRTQLAERLAWSGAWTDSGRVFTREDGSQLRPGWVSEHFLVLVTNADLPPIRFHDLRHCAATMLLGAGVDPKVISRTLGHATVAFTMDVYTEVSEALAEAAADAVAAYIRAGAKNVPDGRENRP